MIALIVARAGSKTVPHKNIKHLDGRPLICYTFETALKSTKIDKVILSTDSPEVADLARTYKIEVPFMRPKELATDKSKIIDTFIYTIDRLKDEFKYDIKSFVTLQPTSPLRLTEDIDNAIDLFNKKKPKALISVCENSFPVEWTLKMSKQGFLSSYIDKEVKIGNRQDYEKVFIPNGAIYIFDYEALKAKRTYYSEQTYGFIMPPERSIDIDTELDFKFTEYLIQTRRASKKKNGREKL